MMQSGYTKSLLLWSALLYSLGAMAEPVDFTLPDLDGKQRQLSEFRGRWVLVNYWATWCPPCLEELPELEVFHNNHKDDDALVVGVNVEAIEPERLRLFVEEQFLSFPILRSGSVTETELGSVRALPTSYLISPQGEVMARQIGPVNAEMIEAFIAKHPEQGR